MLKIVTCLAAVAIAVGGSTLTASAKKSRYGYRMYPREEGYYPDGYRRRHVVIHIHPRHRYDGGYPYDGQRETHIHIYGKGRGSGSAGGGDRSPGSVGGAYGRP